jgi:ferredoxin
LIFCFTGTGNSLYAAQTIASANRDKVILIADAYKAKQFTYTLTDNESVGIVFPVYFWGLPTIVDEFISQLQLNNYKEETFTYVVFTCGASTGNAVHMLEGKLREGNHHLDSGFAVILPDVYILLLELIPAEKQERLLQKASEELDEIGHSVANKDRGIFKVKPGLFPRLKTFILYPFYKYGRNTKQFNITDDCIECGLCAEICPSGTIQLIDERPHWDKEKCVQCLACLHRCPTAAIQYGKATYRRGRYVNPKAKF